MEGLIASYLRQERNEQRRAFETTRIAVNHGFAGESKSFDEVFPEPKPQPKPAASTEGDDESDGVWWDQSEPEAD